MSLRVTTTENVAAVFDSVSGETIGPVFSSAEEAEEFLQFLYETADLRTMGDGYIAEAARRWLLARNQ